MNEITTIDVLGLIRQRAQWMRENGESDMRSILYMVSGLTDLITKGATREEIFAEFIDDEEE